MQQVMSDVSEDFVSFLKNELASKGLENSSLKNIFTMYIERFFKGDKFINEVTPADRQILLVEEINNSIVLTFKYFLESNEYLELEAIISDKYVTVSYSESPELHLLYDSEFPIVINNIQLIHKVNNYGLSLADIFGLLFKALFTIDVSLTVRSLFNSTNIFDRIEPFLEENDQKGDRDYDLANKSYFSSIWIF